MRKLRKKVKQAHQLAQVIADRCDFIVAERIATAFFDFGTDDYGVEFAIDYIEVRDPVEVPQIMCAFVYGATMTGLSFEINRESHGVTLILNNENKMSKKTTNKAPIKNEAPIKAVTTKRCFGVAVVARQIGCHPIHLTYIMHGKRKANDTLRRRLNRMGITHTAEGQEI